jgi:hypothetical protein
MNKKIAALATTAFLTVAISTTAATASVTPNKGPGPRGVQTTGYLKSERNPSWCLTEPATAEDGDVAYMERCETKGSTHARQVWHCGMIKGLGECSPIIGDEPLNLGQRGKTGWALLINPNKNGSRAYILHFIKVTGVNSYVLENTGYHNYKLAIPTGMETGRLYHLEWRDNSAKHVTFVFKTGNWKEDPLVEPKG